MILRIFFSAIIIFCGYISKCQNHVHTDSYITSIIREGLEKTYNFEFDAAEKKYVEVRKKYPNSPAFDLLMSINLYWRMMSENSYKKKNLEYYEYLQRALLLADKLLEKNKNDLEGVFFSLSLNSGLALYHAQNGDHLKALGAAKDTYDYMKQGFKLKGEFPDFYYSTGLYDYYVVQYPENHPVYKPFLFFFADGNKQRGLKEMDYASEHGVYTHTEANFYLTHAYLKYENQPEKALKYSERLAKKFPKNFFYISRYIETLIFLERYDEAEVLNNSLAKTGQKFFDMSAQVFSGLINEKHLKKLDAAKANYTKAINIHQTIEFPLKDYLSFAYAGMARIAAKSGNKEEARVYYKKALDVGYYTSIIKEAEAYLK